MNTSGDDFVFGMDPDYVVETEDNSDDIEVEDRDRVESDMHYKRIGDLTADDIWGLEFGSANVACNFYRTYAMCHGFVSRKDNVSCNLRGEMVMRQLVCNREGIRDNKHLNKVDRCRGHKAITRTNCTAKFKVHLDHKSCKWKVIAFEEGHNHELTPPQYAHLVPAYQGLSNGDKAQDDSLHKYGVRTCHIMGYIVGQKGGYANVGFTKKNLYNHIDQHRRMKLKDGDANAGIS